MMKSYSTLKNRSNITSLTIGGFDGMHKAHQELFKNLDKNGAILVIETGYANITPLHYRQKYTKIPIFYYILEDIKHLSGEEFIKVIQKEFINIKKIVVGFDFGFGKNRSCSSKDLIKIFKNKIKVINEISINNIPIHSRIIREYLKKGDIKTTNLLLNRYYEIEGNIIKGQGIGKKSFVPTINLIIDIFLLPSNGVYITQSTINNKYYNSITFIGNRLSTDNQYSIETHIINKKISHIDSTIQIKFIDKLRNNIKFDNYQTLKKQILIDIENCRKYTNI